MTALQAGTPSTITSEPDNIYAIKLTFASPKVRDQALVELRAIIEKEEESRS